MSWSKILFPRENRNELPDGNRIEATSLTSSTLGIFLLRQRHWQREPETSVKSLARLET